MNNFIIKQIDESIESLPDSYIEYIKLKTGRLEFDKKSHYYLVEKLNTISGADKKGNEIESDICRNNLIFSILEQDRDVYLVVYIIGGDCDGKSLSNDVKRIFKFVIDTVDDFVNKRIIMDNDLMNINISHYYIQLENGLIHCNGE